jgi:hypothetical protein
VNLVFGLQDAKSVILSQISLDQGTQAGQQLHYAYGITEMPPTTRNSFAAQLGRSQPRRREAFLLLARSQCIGGTAKVDRHCRNHQRGIVIRVVMVRQRGEGVEPVVISDLSQSN